MLFPVNSYQGGTAMISTPNNTQQGYERAEQSGPDRDGFGLGSSARPRWALRIAGALGVCAALSAALFVLISSGFESSARTPTASGRVMVAVTAPTSNAVIASDHVTVRGTVTPGNATVQIQGQPAAVGNGVFTGAATLHGGKTTIDVIGSAPGATPGSARIVIARQSAGGTGGTTPPASAAPTPAMPYSAGGSAETACGNELAVGPDTTCAFAENVRSAYGASGPGTVMAYSPVTDQTYAMSCSAGDAVVCTGGDNASVYFPSGSANAAYGTTQPSSGEATPAIAHAGSSSGETACGDGLSVGADTTCAFAENVRSAYESSGPGTVMAYSPVTNRTYAMTCSDGSLVVCTGGNNASVYFP